MAKAKLQSKCKLCLLLQQNRDLWITVHRYIIDEGRSKTEVCNWLNAQMEALAKDSGEKPVKFNSTNFTTHFKAHIPDSKKMKIELKASMRETESPAFSPNEKVIAEIAGEKEEGPDYSEYPKIMDHLEKVIINDLKNTSAVVKSDGSLNIPQADLRLKMFTQLLAGKQKLAEIQQSEKVGGVAVREGMMALGHAVIDANQKLAQEIKDILTQQMPESSFPNEVYQLILDSTVETLKAHFGEIYGSVMKKYSLRG
jgi:hypothetical protein